MGIRAPGLLPFGAEVVVKKKTWHQREDATGLKWPMKKATLFGPASDMSMSSKGYYVRDQEGRFFRTTVVHHVWNLDNKIDGGLQRSADQRRDPEREEAQVRDDAPGNAEDATCDVVEEPLQEPKELEGKVEEMNVEGTACQERVMLEEIEIKKIPVGPVYDPPRYRQWKKAAPIQRQHGQPVVFKAVAEEGGEVADWAQDDEGEVQLALSQHQALVKLGRELVGEIEEKAGEEELKQLRQLQEEVKGLEVVLKKCESQHQEVLEKEVVQTKLVSMDEVRRNMEEWKPAFQAEVDKLKQEALEPIAERRFREMLKEEKEIECLPMKTIACLKPPAKHKGRVVVCGNLLRKRAKSWIMLQVALTRLPFEQH